MSLGRPLRRQMKQKKAATKTRRGRKVSLEPLKPRLLLSSDPTMQVELVLEVENNNTPSTATILPLVEDPAGSGLFLVRGLGAQDPALLNDAWSDPDYWRVEALVGDVVSVSVDTPESAVDPYVELRNAADTSLRGESDSGPGWLPSSAVSAEGANIKKASMNKIVERNNPIWSFYQMKVPWSSQ